MKDRIIKNLKRKIQTFLKLKRKANSELLLYTNDWSYVCSLTITKEQMEEKLEDV